MKFTGLSPAARELIAELKHASEDQLHRDRKTCAFLHRLAETGEVAVIPEILGFLVDDDSAVTAATAAALQALFAAITPAQLPAFDEWMRSGNLYSGPVSGDPRWPKLLPVQVNAFARGDPARSALLLGLASCHWNGYVRQHAVACLDQHVHSGDEIPFLLVRLGDWALPVREQAEAAVSRRLNPALREHYLACLPLVARLRERKRIFTSSKARKDRASLPLFSRVEALLRLDLPSLLSAALSATGQVTRRFGLGLAWNAAAELGQDAAGRLVEQALQARDQMALVQTARWLIAGETHPQLQRRFMAGLMINRIPAVRRIALDWCATHQPADCRDALNTALLDRSRSVRNIAQFHLGKLDSVDLRSFYRQAVSQHDPRTLTAALGGLAETGQAKDAGEIVALVRSRRTSVRKAALSAITLLAGAKGNYFPLFIEALQDPSPACSRQARLALEGHAREIGQDRLKKLFFGTSAPHVRGQTLRLSTVCPNGSASRFLSRLPFGPS